jgi:3-phosphoglycerate kinase
MFANVDMSKYPHVYLSTGGGALLEHIESEVTGTPALPGLSIFVQK